MFRSLFSAGLLLAAVSHMVAAESMPTPGGMRSAAHPSIVSRPGDIIRVAARAPESPTEAADSGVWTTPFMPSRALAVDDGSGDVFMATYTVVDSGVEALVLHRVGPGGAPRWGSPGVTITRSVQSYALVADGTGGVYVAWLGPMRPTPHQQVWLQHLDGAGAPTCGPDGFLVDPGSLWQELDALSPDGVGGVVLAWTRWVPDAGSSHIAMRFDATGSPRWGAPVEPQSMLGLPATILGDRVGGAFLLSESFYLRPTGDYGCELRIQRVGPDLEPLWGPGGIAFGVGYELPCLRAFPDGLGGVVLGWLDVNLHAHAQRLGADGARLWGADGVESTAPRFGDVWESGLPSLEVLSDGQGGVCFAQTRGLPDSPAGRPLRMIVQRVGADGAVRWPEAGVHLYDDVISQPWYLCPNPTGGIDVLWRDTEGPRCAVRVQRIGGDGAAQWGPGGRIACDSRISVWPLPPEPTGDGGVLAAWEDMRAIPRQAALHRSDLYGQRFTSAGEALWGTRGACVSTTWIGQLKPSIVRSGDGAMVVWSEGDSHALRVWARTFEPDGAARAARWPVSDAAVPQREPIAVGDGEGGAFVAWEQVGLETTDLYVQHLTADGSRAWGAEGALVRRPRAACTSPALVAVAGGVVVAWVEDEATVRVQRMDAAGQPRWTGEGVVVSRIEGSPRSPVITPDEMGGVLIGWIEWRDESAEQTALQRLDGDGHAMWAGDVVVPWPVYSLSSPPRPRLAPDGAGGAYVVATASSVQHLDADGHPTWPGDGVRVGALQETWRAPDLALGPTGDLLVYWVEDRDGRDRPSLFTQRLSITGEPAWPSSGVFLAAGPPAWARVHPLATSDGGAMVVWLADHAAGESPQAGAGVGAQRVSSRGTPYWPWTPIALSGPTARVCRGDAVADGADGAYVAWEEVEGRNGRSVRMQHVDALGSTTWGTEGFAPELATVASIAPSARRVSITWRVSGGTAVVRAERRTERGEWGACGAVTVGDAGLVTLGEAVEPATRYAYRLRVTTGGAESTSEISWIETPPLAAMFTGVSPSPARGPFTVEFALAEGAPAELELFDIAGRRVDHWPLAGLAPGRHTLTLGDARPLRPGLYVVRLSQGGHTETHRVVMLR